MLEGTKHEKAVLIVLAYIIGLTSGFIGFGVSDYYVAESVKYTQQVNAAKDEHSALDEVNMANPEQTHDVSPDIQTPIETTNENIIYEDGELSIKTEEGDMILSVHINQLGDVIPDLLVTQGHHIEQPIYLSSPEGRYIYFCEQHLGEDECTNLIFDTESTSIQYVQAQNEKFASPISLAATAYWSVAGLHIGNLHSESATTPWKLVQNTQ